MCFHTLYDEKNKYIFIYMRVNKGNVSDHIEKIKKTKVILKLFHHFKVLMNVY